MTAMNLIKLAESGGTDGPFRLDLSSGQEELRNLSGGCPCIMRGSWLLSRAARVEYSLPASAAGSPLELLRGWIRLLCPQSRRGVWILLGMLHQPCLDRVHPEIFDMFCVLVCVSDPVLVVTLLPYFTMEDHLPPRTVGESALDELHCFLKRYEWSRCKDQVNVISHEDELVYLKPLSGPTFTNDVQQQIAKRIGLQYESSLPGCKRGEESASFLRCGQHSRGDVITPAKGRGLKPPLAVECGTAKPCPDTKPMSFRADRPSPM